MTTIDTLISQTKLLESVTERLDTVSDKGGIDSIELNHELIDLILDLYIDSEDFPYERMKKFSIEDILAYLQATHKYYLNKKLPEIEQSLLHIFSKYGQSHQLLAHLAMFFNEYKNNLIAHIRMEEKQLFPYIKTLVDLSKNVKPQKKIDENFSIQKFISSHSPIEDELKEVSQIIKKYSDEKTTPLPYKIFLNQVELFELELQKHAIIEDYVLVPMVVELEKTLK